MQNRNTVSRPPMPHKPEFMQQAIDSAREGILAEEGGPFGACVVKDGEVISVAHNTVLKDGDPTCHAEMNAIRAACRKLGTHILEGCELYTTAEPCPMCLAGIYWSRLSKFYVGVDRNCAAKHGFDDAFFYEQLDLPVDKRAVPAEYEVLSDDCEAVFTQWKELGGELY